MMPLFHVPGHDVPARQRKTTCDGRSLHVIKNLFLHVRPGTAVEHKVAPAHSRVGQA